ncbi:hypothetical protein M0812_06913 [Anaeramoeba flamelloides]|uniref:Transmembrane protein n=1 Tax=Anaeramoeba flamelloides TaxID=1746091 RepID=A0AAV8AD57_9EUKA|nr:hypothetical protein M0812_06913 [Anaeramoeba flamelloides]
MKKYINLFILSIFFATVTLNASPNYQECQPYANNNVLTLTNSKTRLHHSQKTMALSNDNLLTVWQSGDQFMRQMSSKVISNYDLSYSISNADGEIVVQEKQLNVNKNVDLRCEPVLEQIIGNRVFLAWCTNKNEIVASVISDRGSIIIPEYRLIKNKDHIDHFVSNLKLIKFGFDFFVTFSVGTKEEPIQKILSHQIFSEEHEHKKRGKEKETETILHIKEDNKILSLLNDETIQNLNQSNGKSIVQNFGIETTPNSLYLIFSVGSNVYSMRVAKERFLREYNAKKQKKFFWDFSRFSNENYHHIQSKIIPINKARTGSPNLKIQKILLVSLTPQRDQLFVTYQDVNGKIFYCLLKETENAKPNLETYSNAADLNSYLSLHHVAQYSNSKIILIFNEYQQKGSSNQKTRTKNGNRGTLKAQIIDLNNQGYNTKPFQLTKSVNSSGSNAELVQAGHFKKGGMYVTFRKRGSFGGNSQIIFEKLDTPTIRCEKLIKDKKYCTNRFFSFRIPKSIFTQFKSLKLKFDVVLYNGDSLPEWIKSNNLVFWGQTPKKPINTTLKIIVSNDCGFYLTIWFNLIIEKCYVPTPLPMPSTLPTFNPSTVPSFSLPPIPSFSLPPIPSFSMPPFPSFSLPPFPSFSMPPIPSFSMPPIPSFSMPPIPSFSINPYPTITAYPSFSNPVNPSQDPSPSPSNDPHPSQSIIPSNNPQPSQSIEPSQSPEPSKIINPSSSPKPSQFIEPTTTPALPSSNPNPSRGKSTDEEPEEISGLMIFFICLIIAVVLIVVLILVVKYQRHKKNNNQSIQVEKENTSPDEDIEMKTSTSDKSD